MTLSEFKAWFEGFTENIDGTPSKKQWERIQARVAEIDGKVVTREIIRDRYLPYQAYPRPYWNDLGITYCTNSVGEAKALNAVGFDASAAMHDVGKIEFEATKAA